MTLKRHGFVRERAFRPERSVHINTLNSEIIKTKAEKLGDFPEK
jgi:hypothetical protein